MCGACRVKKAASTRAPHTGNYRANIFLILCFYKSDHVQITFLYCSYKQNIPVISVLIETLAHEHKRGLRAA